MYVLQARNPHDALPQALRLLQRVGVARASRNGPTLTADGPVTTVYSHPEERVLFWPERDANPFFHFYESLWMLGGRNDVKPLVDIVKRYASYSDDGVTQHAAYGHRWRRHFCYYPEPADEREECVGLDQLAVVIQRLRRDGTDRRSVITMWDPEADLGRAGVDVPCNLVASVQVGTDGRLDLSVFCRSNDIIWGCYGANAVHFSVLQEYLARAIGVPVGRYWQTSVNWHGYTDTFEPLLRASERWPSGNPYREGSRGGSVRSYPLMKASWEHWDGDLARWLEEPTWERPFVDPFFNQVAVPIMRAHRAMKDLPTPERFTAARSELSACQAEDWKRACVEWVMRRESRYHRENDDGPAAQ